MQLLQSIPINITPKNARAIFNFVEIDYKGNLGDGLGALDIEFISEDNKQMHEDQDEEDNLLDSLIYNQPHTVAHESNFTDDTNV